MLALGCNPYTALVYRCTAQAITSWPADSFAVSESVMTFCKANADDGETYGFGDVVANGFEHVISFQESLK